MSVCVCVCVCVFFSPVNPESGIIQSGQLNYPNFKYSKIPAKELNGTDITEQQFTPFPPVAILVVFIISIGI